MGRKRADLGFWFWRFTVHVWVGPFVQHLTRVEAVSGGASAEERSRGEQEAERQGAHSFLWSLLMKPS